MPVEAVHDLPAGVAEPLHLLDAHPYSVYAWLVPLGLLALLVLLELLHRRWRRRRKRPSAAAAPEPRPPVISGIEQTIAQIRDRYLHVDPRRGCHELARRLRLHFELISGQPLSKLTAREITATLGDTATSRFFSLLAELQFARRSPSRDDFRGICEVARDVARAESIR